MSKPQGFSCALKHSDRPCLKLVLGSYEEEPHLRRKYDKPLHIINYAEPYLVLISSDGPVFWVDELSCMESIRLNNVIKYRPCDTTYAQLPSYILEKVVCFINNHAHFRNSDAHQKLKDFHSQFFKENHSLLLDLMKAAYSLCIKSLFDLTSEAVVDMITGKTREETCKILNLKTYFTFQKMAEMRKAESWFY